MSDRVVLRVKVVVAHDQHLRGDVVDVLLDQRVQALLDAGYLDLVEVVEHPPEQAAAQPVRLVAVEARPVAAEAAARADTGAAARPARARATTRRGESRDGAGADHGDTSGD